MLVHTVLAQTPGDKLVDVLRKSGIDTFVFDIQDVGARFYTFVWLLYECMVAAAKLGLKVVILDRPNPVGGVVIEGPVLKRGYESDLGCKPVAMRHGMARPQHGQISVRKLDKIRVK